MKGRCINNCDCDGFLTIEGTYEISLSGAFVTLTCDDGVERILVRDRFEIIENEGEEKCDCPEWKEKAENETRRADELYDQLQIAKQEIIELNNKVADYDATNENLNRDLTYLQQELDRVTSKLDDRLAALDDQRKINNDLKARNDDLLKCIKIIMKNI